MEAKNHIIHVMSDGTIRDSIEGVKITNKEFYIVFNEILRRHANDEKNQKIS